MHDFKAYCAQPQKCIMQHAEAFSTLLKHFNNIWVNLPDIISTYHKSAADNDQPLYLRPKDSPGVVSKTRMSS